MKICGRELRLSEQCRGRRRRWSRRPPPACTFHGATSRRGRSRLYDMIIITSVRPLPEKEFRKETGVGTRLKSMENSE